MIRIFLLLGFSLILLGCLQVNNNGKPPGANAVISAVPTGVPPIPTSSPIVSRLPSAEPTFVPTATVRLDDCTYDSDCIVTGCSDSVCSRQQVFTICSYKQEYACYDAIDCGCNNGVCSWRFTDLFRTCVEDARAREKEVFPPGMPYT